eukprot:TRINITY_DN3454_c0_g1_i7.p4 TRINITY_DN3454_c0_g1~~TRINITY_DN3454_c0_g1_i7.p4  ORF type:complete len:115 (-),score=1.66 TRINITY_DN3454_c0_g1_i7:2-346(-)
MNLTGSRSRIQRAAQQGIKASQKRDIQQRKIDHIEFHLKAGVNKVEKQQHDRQYSVHLNNFSQRLYFIYFNFQIQIYFVEFRGIGQRNQVQIYEREVLEFCKVFKGEKCIVLQK